MVNSGENKDQNLPPGPQTDQNGDNSDDSGQSSEDQRVPVWSAGDVFELVAAYGGLAWLFALILAELVVYAI